MDILKGLNTSQRSLLKHSAAYRDYTPGSLIFKEGDPAYGLYMIVSGEIEIYKESRDGHQQLAVMKSGETFGEMGLFTSNHMRTASAKCLTDCTLYEMPANPVEMLKRIGDTGAAFKLVQNLICILADRLRAKDVKDQRVSSSYKPIASYELDTSNALETIEKSLPSGFFRRYMVARAYKPGDEICHEGDKPEGFWFVHEGGLEVIKHEGGQDKVVNRLLIPTIVGEVGFFSGEERSATLRVSEPVKATYFSASDFEKLKRDDPEEAFRVLFAAAQLTVALIVEREKAGT